MADSEESKNGQGKEFFGNWKLRNVIILGIIVLAVILFLFITGMKQAIKTDDPNLTGFVGFTTPSSMVGQNEKAKNGENEKEKEVIETSAYNSNSRIIMNLQNNSWDRIKAQVTGFTIDEDGVAVFDNYKMYCIGKHVKCVVFDDTYDSSIIGDVKLSDGIQSIKQKLGEPTFETAMGGIGYKTPVVYAFFYDDEVAVYPNTYSTISNDYLENMILDYYNKTSRYTYRTDFIIDMRNSFEDFEIEEEGNEVVCTSTLRQIVIRLDSLKNIEVTTYNNYKETTDGFIELLNDKVFVRDNEDYVRIVENERINNNG